MKKEKITRDEMAALRKRANEHKESEEALKKSEENLHPLVETTQDIPYQKHVKVEPSETQLWLQSIFNSLDEAVFVVTPNRKMVNVNRAGERIFGYALEELKGFSTEILHVDHERYVEFGKRIKKAFDAGRSANFEFKAKRKGGEVFPSEHTVSLLKNQQGEPIGIVSIVRDITDRKRIEDTLRKSETQLRALASSLTKVEEAERKRLARELHDRVGQNLTALNINLNIMKNRLSPQSAKNMETRLADAMNLVEETTEQIRDVMADLRPEVLDDYGLMAALRWYGERFSNRTGIKTEIRGEEQVPRLSPDTETALFRIAQEAMTNVARHARAQCVTISLEEASGVLSRLIVMDDGVGFDSTAPERTGKEHGWGLITMQERAQSSGGRLRVESEPGKGTRIVVEMI
jgi:PAS domain S-box-containing protein